MSKEVEEKRLQYTGLVCDVDSRLFERIEVNTQDTEDVQVRGLHTDSKEAPRMTKNNN